jgi:2,4-dienoyl-CoA reductase-like NADH-dependent reductase (Old Yellow Enzyme family)
MPISSRRRQSSQARSGDHLQGDETRRFALFVRARPASSTSVGCRSGNRAIRLRSIDPPMARLFDSLTLRDVTFRNRVFVSPMCEYTSVDGFAEDWHLVHLGSRAVGGAGLVMTEATAVLPEGRISPQDLGIWKDEHIEELARIVRFVNQQGAAAGIQLAHAGRKASTYTPWLGQGSIPLDQGGWEKVVAPSAEAFADNYPKPQALTQEGIDEIIAGFVAAARRTDEAGFQVAEIHGAHGYLIHEFLSPLTNHRTDAYGGSFEGRTRLLREVVTAVRGVWPERLPLFVRISASDWVEGGWDIEQSIALARELRTLGVDLVDCSSAGNTMKVMIPVGPGYQVEFAARVRREADIPTGAVGMITSPIQAEQIVGTGQADAVLLAREMLRDPYWPLRAARDLGQAITWPVQYLRAASQGAQPRVPFGTLVS